jgi:hypothetical protein
MASAGCRRLSARISGATDFDPERPFGTEDSQSQNLASETLENQGLQEPESDLSSKLAFEPVNAVTWKLTDGRGSNAWSGNRGRGHRTTRAVAWLMGIGGGLWVVRYRDKSSKPMKLPKAKTYALEMVKGISQERFIAANRAIDQQRTLCYSYLSNCRRFTWQSYLTLLI